jgi:hypothetical protein
MLPPSHVTVVLLSGLEQFEPAIRGFYAAPFAQLLHGRRTHRLKSARDFQVLPQHAWRLMVTAIGRLMA